MTDTSHPGLELLTCHGDTRSYVLPDGRVVCENRGTAVTVLLWLGVACLVANSIFVVVLGFSSSDMAPQVALVPLAYAFGLSFLLRRRKRSDGVFQIDPERQVVVQNGTSTIPFEAIARLSARLDWFDRSPMAWVRGQTRWAVLVLDDERVLRLCKARPKELRRLWQALYEAGLPFP